MRAKPCLCVVIWAALSCSSPTAPVALLDVGGPELTSDPDIVDVQAQVDLPPEDVDLCEPGIACTLENKFGQCEGAWVCDGEDGPYCDGAEPAAETCDGVDNDCDGTVDDVPCDDKNFCTEEDYCIDGVCEGVALLCDDGDPCTIDSCDSGKGCLFSAGNGLPCDDGDFCTDSDFCLDGACTGVGIVCQDDDPCTSDSCNPDVGCEFAYAQLPCDDNDPCTVGDFCQEGTCSGTPVSCDCLTDADCDELDDGNLCNGTLFCDLEQFPHKCVVDESTVVVCPEPEGLDAPCLLAACDEQDGTCSLVPANDGKACNDQNACTLGDMCEGGECLGDNALNCNDLNPCTTDTCDPEVGCHFDPHDGACDDGNACTQQELCVDGACGGGKPVACDDENLCTSDSCHPAQGCVFVPNSLPCDDNDACTSGDVCADGACQGGALASCDDSNPCTDDACDPAEGCQHEPNSASCDDNNSCTTNDSCVDGICLGEGSLDCDDDNACTKDICMPQGGCQHEPVSGPCTDLDPCTLNDQCQSGECVSGPPLDCGDQNVCTADSCVNGVCQHDATDGLCDDQNACTEDDACVDGTCQGGSLVECDDDNLCTTDACSPQQGCLHTPNANPCDDGNLCTSGDICSDGACAGQQPVDCDDGNVCTTDQCSPDSGCKHTSVQGPCDDANPCTAQDQCSNGSCVGTALVDCDDGNPCTDDTCNPLVGCVSTNNNLGCDDDDACTTNDVCADGTCHSGAALACDDDNPCTDDTCDFEAGCVFAPNQAGCDDGNACTSDDQCIGGLCVGGPAPDCDDANPCTNDSCDWQTGCVHQANTESCDDGNACTLADQCADGECVGGPPPDCDDGNECTDDSCAADVGCVNAAFVPCCGDGSVDGDEGCDDGADNGVVGIGTCSSQCVPNSRYELVLRMATSGQVLDGDWNDAHARVTEQAQDCFVRFDGRFARADHIEYDANTLRFDFQPLYAHHNTWDAYSYVELKVNSRAGIGGNYRRGHATYVWRKDFAQHAEAHWTPAEVYLYCERESRYEKVSSFAANGTVTEGKSLSDLVALVADEGALCKVRYDSRVSVAHHVEYSKSPERLYFDFAGLRAPYNTWDSYAYIHIDGVHAALAASYRRGYYNLVHLLDRAQNSEAYSTNLPVDVFCRTWTPAKVSTNGAAFTAGTFEAAYQAVVTEGRDCRVGIDSRVVEPQYIEFADDKLVFELSNLHAYNDQWEAFARVEMQATGASYLQTNYRRGNASTVHLKSEDQHALEVNTNLPITLFCDSEHAPAPAFSADDDGDAESGSWSNLHAGLTDVSGGFFCKLKADNRVMMPYLYEYAESADPVYFDMASLAGYYNGYEAYAGMVLEDSQQSSIYSSYRRGHDDYVWRKGRSQYAVVATIPAASTLWCE